jgi:hypothetical protein
MRVHSDEAWLIAQRYSDVLASETRGLAGLIDQAIKRQVEKQGGSWPWPQDYDKKEPSKR